MGAGSIPGIVVALPPVVRERASVSPSRTVPLTRRSRLEGLDSARFVAIAGAIFLHTVESPELSAVRSIGSFGVPFFIFAAIYIQAASLDRSAGRTLDEYLYSRAKRLLLPFLAWNAIYYFALAAKHVLISRTGLPAIDPTWLWVGVGYHLWFLPFLMLVTACTAVLHRTCARRAGSWWTVVVGCALAGVVLSLVPRPWFILDPFADAAGYFVLLAWRATPSVCLAVALGWALSRYPLPKRAMPLLAGLGALLTLVMLGLQISRGYSRFDRTLSGLGWMLVALAPWRGAIVSKTASLGRLSYGMYLSHALFVEGTQTAFRVLGFAPSVAIDLTVFAVAIIGSASLAAALARSKRLSWLNGQ